MSKAVNVWKNKQKNMGNQLHSVCSYMAMFPPSIPNHFIQKYSKVGEVVLDPFCGRGTTILEAGLLNRKAIGNDKNVLASVLSKSKANTPQKSRILSRIGNLEQEYRSEKINVEDVEEHIKMIFSDSTLEQLVFLKRKLRWKISNIDNFITAMILGIMHGGSQGYLSLKMPNTFSMSPNYVKNYIQEHGLEKPERNVFTLLRSKLERCYQNCKSKGKIYMQDTRNMSRIKTSSVDLIITSPPYVRLITYGKFNWIRLWFLGEDGGDVDKKLFTTQSMPRYCNFMSEVLTEFKRVLKPGGISVIVIGDVQNRKTLETQNLAATVWEKCAEPLGFTKTEEIIEDIIDDGESQNPRVSRIWGKTKGKATKIDRILVLKNSN